MSREILTLAPPPSGIHSAYGPDPSQFGELRLPTGAGPHPVVINIHGGFWQPAYGLEHAGHLCVALSAAGAATWNIEYRRAGQPGGGWPGTFQDVLLAAEHLTMLAQEHPLDLSRVLVLGHSAGGHLALWLAGSRSVPAGDPLHRAHPGLSLSAAVSLAGAVDLRRAAAAHAGDGAVTAFMGATPEQEPERYNHGSPIELLPLGLRQILIVGSKDAPLLRESSETYVAAARAAGDDAALLVLEGADHFDVIDPRTPHGASVVAAVLALLGGVPE